MDIHIVRCAILVAIDWSNCCYCLDRIGFGFSFDSYTYCIIDDSRLGC